MAWTTPGTAVASTVLTASFWNTQVRDNFKVVEPFFTTWTAYTPGFKQGSKTLTISDNGSKYLKVGRFVSGATSFKSATAGTALNDIRFSVPSAATPINNTTNPFIGFAIGSFFYQRTGGDIYSGTLFWTGIDGDYCHFSVGGLTTGGSYMGTSPSFAVAVGDIVCAFFSYETDE